MSICIGCPCYATNQGIGILARSFYDHGVVTNPIIIAHGRHPNNLEWYLKDSLFIGSLRSEEDRKKLFELVKSLDVLFCIETPFLWELIPYCRRHNVRTVLLTMYECTQPHRFRDPDSCPDLFICPSLLDLQYFNELATPAIHLPLPIEVKWKQRAYALEFVHNAGHGGLLGRNGTKELIEAMHYVRSPVYLLLRTQDHSACAGICPPDNVSVHIGTIPYSELYAHGDVFVFPDKFSGQSCPLEEAYAAGMLVMGSNRFPHNTYLPNDPLIPVSSSRKNQIGNSYNTFNEAIIDPRDIARTIDEWYGKDISTYSQQGLEFAKARSWERLKPIWMEQLTGKILSAI